MVSAVFRLSLSLLLKLTDSLCQSSHRKRLAYNRGAAFSKNLYLKFFSLKRLVFCLLPSSSSENKTVIKDCYLFISVVLFSVFLVK